MMASQKLSLMLVLGAALAGCANLDERGNAAVGGAIGGATGAVIGHDVGGANGAVVGAGLGAVAGAAIGQSATGPARETVIVHEHVIYKDKGKRQKHKRKHHHYHD